MTPTRSVYLPAVRCPSCGDEHVPAHDSALCADCADSSDLDPALGVIGWGAVAATVAILGWFVIGGRL